MTQTQNQNQNQTGALNDRTKTLRAHNQAHHLHPFTNFHRFAKERVPRVIERAQGVWLWDSEGNQILDGMAGLWCVNVGYGREEIAEAIYQQAKTLPFYNTFFKTAHPPVIELSEKLAELAPKAFNRVFYTNSGSEANDTVIRMVRQYWAALGQPERSTIISRWNAYHGSTLGGASLGGMKAMHKMSGMPVAGVHHIEQPYWYQHGADLSPEAFGLQAAAWLREAIESIGPDKVAAFIGEPIQGAGGVIIPPESYWPEVQAICREYGILLVSDEVICGFGRTGEWFGSQGFGVEPDLMPIAKGLSSGYQPIGGVLVSDKVADVLLSVDSEFVHGFTYSGHPIACAAALANLQLIEQEGLVTRVKHDTGPYLIAALEQALQDHPLVGEVRARGLMAAIELVRDKAQRRFFRERGEVGEWCRDFSFDNGLVMRATNDTMILSPPLCITRQELDTLIERVRKSIDQTWEKVCADQPA